MNQLTNKTVSFTTASRTDGRGADRDLMNFFLFQNPRSNSVPNVHSETPKNQVAPRMPRSG